MLRGEELSQAYASADIFMMPSETETLGFVALEAMASGLPVVAVAAGGPCGHRHQARRNWWAQLVAVEAPLACNLHDSNTCHTAAQHAS